MIINNFLHLKTVLNGNTNKNKKLKKKIFNYYIYMKSPSVFSASATLIYDYRRFIKIKKEVIDPYEGQVFKIKPLIIEEH